MKIIPCPSSPLLARRIAEVSGREIGNAVFKKFPDGELYVRVAEREGVVVGSINSNDDLIALLFALNVLAKAVAVVPYMGYARQDRVFQEGEAVSIKILAEMLESVAEEVITVNIHSNEAASHFKRLKNLDAMPVIGKFFAEKDIVMVSPDEGSKERVRTAAKNANCEWDYMEKRRIDATTVEITPKNIDVEGKDVVIVDDIISTGGTVAEAARILYSLGAKSVRAACVHAVLANNAAIKLINSGIKDIVATDTIECAFSRVSVAELIASNI